MNSSSFFKLNTGFYDNTTRVIGPCIDIDCSGLNEKGKPVYRIFNTLFEMKKHSGNGKRHDLAMGCVLNLEKPNGWEYYLIKNGINKFYYLREIEAEDVQKKEKGKVRNANKGNKAGSMSQRPIIHSKSLSLIGHNSTTICSKENKELLNVYLNELYNQDKIALLMLNEVGKVAANKVLDRSLRDKFSIMGSGTKTALIFDKRLKVSMIMDKLNDNYNQIAMVTNIEGKRLIVYNVYVAPGADHGARVDAAKLRLRTILDRYKDKKLVVFGDFNMKRDEMKKKFIDSFKDKKIMCHMDSGANSFTRCRKVLDSIQCSYLDYFLTYGVECSKFEIAKSIAKSDHMTLRLTIPNSELGNIVQKRELSFDFNGPKNDAADIFKRLKNIFVGEDRLNPLIDMVKELRVKYKPRCRMVKKCYTFKEKVRSLVEGKADWKQFGDAIRRISREQYSDFMLNIGGLKLKRNLKEYFMKMRFYSEISKSAGTFTDLEEYVPDEDMISLITSKLEIDDKVYEKYSKLFDDKGEKKLYLIEEGTTIVVNGWEVSNALENISFEKAISWDYIPGAAFKEIFNLKANDRAAFDECCSGIASLLSELLLEKGPIPDEIF